MRLRFALSTIVLLMLAANPCFAKGSHAHHGAPASAVGNPASGKGGSGAKSSPSKANVPSEEGPIIAPPVLPPHGVAHQQLRIVNPSIKTLGPANASRSEVGATFTTPSARNAIGQLVVPPKNFGSAQPSAPAGQRPGAIPNLHGGPAATPVVSSATPHVNLANATNRGSVNGATVIRPAAGPALIGGPAQVRYGINGTTVQNKH